MTMFEWLEETGLAIWVGESMLGYPLMLSLHAVGLGLVVGVFSVLGLRLLGLFGSVPLAAFRTPMRIAWFGFLVNAASGTALFTSQASILVTSAPFLIKAVGVVGGGLVGGAIHWHLRDAATPPEVSMTLRLLGFLSLFSWTLAIVTGRLIAYL